MCKTTLLVLFSVIFLSACSNGDNSDSSSINDILTGVFLDSPVSGVTYNTETQSGITNTEGEFNYMESESVTFSIGDLTFPTVMAAPTITPLDMSPSGDINDNVVINTVALLQSMDTDSDAENGIQISDTASASATSIDLNADYEAFSQDANVVNMIANSGSTTTEIVPEQVATSHFQKTLVANSMLTGISKEQYTSLVVGNTLLWNSEQTIYYGPDGVKYVRRSNGEEYTRTWWLDESSLLCETIADESTYCLADVQDYLVTVANDGGTYNYSELGYTATFSIAEGDSMSLAPESSPDGYTQVSGGSLSQIFDKSLYLHDGTELTNNFIVVRSDGTFDGNWMDEPIAGTWEMRDSYWCRILTVFHNAAALGSEDCQLWEINGDMIRGTRDRGAGVSFIYHVVSDATASYPCAEDPMIVNLNSAALLMKMYPHRSSFGLETMTIPVYIL